MAGGGDRVRSKGSRWGGGEMVMGDGVDVMGAGSGRGRRGGKGVGRMWMREKREVREWKQSGVGRGVWRLMQDGGGGVGTAVGGVGGLVA